MESKASKSRVMSVYFISRHIAGQVVYYSGCLRMHALLWSICREFSKSTLRQPPQTTSPCETDGNIILKYKSNRAFLLKNELLFKTISLLTILVFICKFFMWPGKQVIDSNAQKTSVFHPLDSISLQLSQTIGPMCCLLINSIASHFAEWGVKKVSRHHLFSSVG